jgi:uncharacterized membrane protein
MRSTTLGLAALAAVCAFGACDRSDRPSGGSPETATTPRVLRGYARWGDEVREFTPCDSMEAVWVVDSSQALWIPYRELARDPADTMGLFAVVEGPVVPTPPVAGLGAGHARTLVVHRVLYVAREGYGCAAPWDRFAYRAFGSEPFWSLTVAGDSVTLIRPGEAERTWHGTRDSTAAGLTMSAGNPATDGVAVSLRATPCRDTMAGSYFGYTAAVRLRGDSLAGCALVGGGR